MLTYHLSPLSNPVNPIVSTFLRRSKLCFCEAVCMSEMRSGICLISSTRKVIMLLHFAKLQIFLVFPQIYHVFFHNKDEYYSFLQQKYRGVAFFDYNRWIVISYYKLPFLRLRRLNYKIKNRRLQSACVYVVAFVFLLHDYGNSFSISC